jgi:acylphosphatase
MAFKPVVLDFVSRAKATTMIRYNIKITGKVQGVNFRRYTHDTAERMGVKGFVQNEPDGSVYCEAEGGEKVLQMFIDQLAIGPVTAAVKEVDVTLDMPKGFTIFEIKRV